MPFTKGPADKTFYPKIILGIIALLFLFPSPTFSATFGYTGLGASNFLQVIRTSGGFQRNTRVGKSATPADAGTVTQISVGLIGPSGNDTITTTVFLNTESTGDNSLPNIGSAEQDIALTSTGTFFNFSTSISVTAIAYVLSVVGDWADITAGRDMWNLYDSGSGSGNRYSELFSGAGAYAASKEDPWTTAETADTNRVSIYATYTASGGAATPPSAPNPPPIFFDGDSQLYPAKPERFTYQLKKINGRRSY